MDWKLIIEVMIAIFLYDVMDGVLSRIHRFYVMKIKPKNSKKASESKIAQRNKPTKRIEVLGFYDRRKEEENDIS